MKMQAKSQERRGIFRGWCRCAMWKLRWTTALSGNSTIGRMSDLIVKNGGSVLMSEICGFPE